MIGRILIPLFEDPLDYRLLDAAGQFTSCNAACLQVGYFRSEPVEELVYGSEVSMTGLMVEALEERSQTVKRNITLRLRDWCAQRRYEYVDRHSQICPCQVSFVERIGKPVTELMRLGRLNDLILCLRPNDDIASSQQVFDVAVSTTGRPVLALPQSPPADLMSHVLLAWDGSQEATRLISLSLPVLRLAKRLSVFCYPDKDCDTHGIHDLMHYFSCHGIASDCVDVRQSKPIGEALVEAANTVHASLIAMGAYSHSRAHQYFLGGLTRHMVEKTELPLLLTH